jgi:hypothetical protein
LLDFEINLQLFVEIMEDEEFPKSARMLAAGVLFHVLWAQGIIPEKLKNLKLIALVDDVLVMAVGLCIIVHLMPEERREYYWQKYEAVTRIDDYKQLLKSPLGMLRDRLAQFVESLRRRSYKKKTAEKVVESPDLQEGLFDEAMIFAANFNLDPDSIDQQIRLLPPRERIMGLLSGGLQEETSGMLHWLSSMKSASA